MASLVPDEECSIFRALKIVFELFNWPSYHPGQVMPSTADTASLASRYVTLHHTLPFCHFAPHFATQCVTLLRSIAQCHRASIWSILFSHHGTHCPKLLAYMTEIVRSTHGYHLSCIANYASVQGSNPAENGKPEPTTQWPNLRHSFKNQNYNISCTKRQHLKAKVDIREALELQKWIL